MTRKDYELIAAALRSSHDRIACGTLVDSAVRSSQQAGVRKTAAHLADALALDNPRFDPTRFLKACGYGA